MRKPLLRESVDEIREEDPRRWKTFYQENSRG